MTKTLATPNIAITHTNPLGKLMDSSQLIDALGGTTVVATLLNVKPPSVHAWRKGAIPDDKLIRLAPVLEKAGVITRKELFPLDWQAIWPELVPMERRATDPEPEEGRAGRQLPSAKNLMGLGLDQSCNLKV